MKKLVISPKIFLIVLGFFVLLALIFIAIKNLEAKKDVATLSNQACTWSGMLPKSDYLTAYTIQPGDSLLSISKNILGDASRVNELIVLNQDRYPQLSMQNSFIEQGWEILLPPTEVERTNGNIVIVGGRLSVSEFGWGVNWTNSGVGPFKLSELPDEMYEDDCVVVMYQAKDSSGGEIKVLSIDKPINSIVY